MTAIKTAAAALLALVTLAGCGATRGLVAPAAEGVLIDLTVN